LRSSQGRAYRRHFHRLATEFSDADIRLLKELATLHANFEKIQVDTLVEDYWGACRARDALPSLSRLIEKKKPRYAPHRTRKPNPSRLMTRRHHSQPFSPSTPRSPQRRHRVSPVET